jgi:hypothetical protein
MMGHNGASGPAGVPRLRLRGFFGQLVNRSSCTGQTNSSLIRGSRIALRSTTVGGSTAANASLASSRVLGS